MSTSSNRSTRSTDLSSTRDWGLVMPTFEISTDDSREKWEELYRTLECCADAYRRASRGAVVEEVRPIDAALEPSVLVAALDAVPGLPR